MGKKFVPELAIELILFSTSFKHLNGIASCGSDGMSARRLCIGIFVARSKCDNIGDQKVLGTVFVSIFQNQRCV